MECKSNRMWHTFLPKQHKISIFASEKHLRGRSVSIFLPVLCCERIFRAILEKKAKKKRDSMIYSGDTSRYIDDIFAARYQMLIRWVARDNL